MESIVIKLKGSRKIERETKNDDEWKTLEKLSNETSSNLKMMDSRKSCWKFNFRYFSFRLCFLSFYFLCWLSKSFLLPPGRPLSLCVRLKSLDRPPPQVRRWATRNVGKSHENRAREKKGEIERIKVGFFEISLPRAFKFSSFLKLVQELSSFPFFDNFCCPSTRDFKHESRGNWKISHLSTTAARTSLMSRFSLSRKLQQHSLLMAESNYFEIKQNKYVLSGASQGEMNVQRHQ